MPKYTNKVIPYRIKRSKSPDPPKEIHPSIRVTNSYIHYKHTAISDHNYSNPFKPCVVYTEDRHTYKTYPYKVDISYSDTKYIRQPYNAYMLPLDLLITLPLYKDTLKPDKEYTSKELIELLWHQYNVILSILHGDIKKELSSIFPDDVVQLFNLSSRDKVSLVNYLETLSTIIHSESPTFQNRYTNKQVLRILQLDDDLPDLNKSSYFIHKFILKLDGFLSSLAAKRKLKIELV